MHKEVHPQQLPRRRTEQGRIRLPRSMRREVLRGQHQGVREDARRGAGETRRWWIHEVEQEYSADDGRDPRGCERECIALKALAFDGAMRPTRLRAVM
ncbi:hypothetical protein CB0940_11676 [Cercospora beticola]|uniref:Uncharacterized protein n=1 Tax=Cercospora beticola TaxID=122368 RepID=A0A2G5IED7_CERBT|nr:hypothetical protein CB0940_11676 [Cercospora beticola]PIB03228.1 hypothetical protein CB0940_11676 [Cercospora beticola]